MNAKHPTQPIAPAARSTGSPALAQLTCANGQSYTVVSPGHSDTALALGHLPQASRPPTTSCTGTFSSPGHGHSHAPGPPYPARFVGRGHAGKL
jgi:hypothetical protein